MCYVSVFASLRACLCLGSIASQLDCSHDWNPRVVGIQSKLQVTSLCNLQDTIWYGLQSFALYKAMKFAPICRSWRQWCNFKNANREQHRLFRKHFYPEGFHVCFDLYWRGSIEVTCRRDMDFHTLPEGRRNRQAHLFARGQEGSPAGVHTTHDFMGEMKVNKTSKDKV